QRPDWRGGVAQRPTSATRTRAIRRSRATSAGSLRGRAASNRTPATRIPATNRSAPKRWKKSATSVVLTPRSGRRGEIESAAAFILVVVRVLLTNDDGIEADGLQTLRRALLRVPGIEVAVV